MKTTQKKAVKKEITVIVESTHDSSSESEYSSSESGSKSSNITKSGSSSSSELEYSSSESGSKSSSITKSGSSSSSELEYSSSESEYSSSESEYSSSESGSKSSSIAKSGSSSSELEYSSSESEYSSSESGSKSSSITKSGSSSSSELESEDSDSESAPSLYRRSKSAPSLKSAPESESDSEKPSSSGSKSGPLLLAINVDYTSREESINTLEKLSAKLIDFILNEKPSIITISEAPSPYLVTLLEISDLKRNGYRWEFSKIGLNKYNDYIITGYNSNLYNLLPIDDKENLFISTTYGKYQACLLKESQTQREILHLSIHHPHKIKKDKAIESTSLIIKNFIDKVNGVILSGDFNSSHDKVNRYSGLTNSFNGESTTTKATTPDNILYSSNSLHLSSKKVYKGVIDLSHHPIAATFEWR